jgi:hypothetical protein
MRIPQMNSLSLVIKCDICYEVAKRFERALGEDNIRESSQYIGFRYGHGVKFNENYAKDLTGFIDGTRNPDHVLRAIIDNCVIFEDDDEGRHVGGTYLYAGRFVHNLMQVSLFFLINISLLSSCDSLRKWILTRRIKLLEEISVK